MPNFKIDIISDPVCPWCYIGHKRLSRAISLFQRTHPSGSLSSFNLTYQAYYLDSDAPKEGIPWAERSAQRFGGPERVQAMRERLAKVGLPEGITFSFDSKIGSTRDAHRLIALGRSKGQERQIAVVENLFRGYFEGGADITDVNWLQKVGVESGLEEKEVKTWLEGNGGGDLVDEEAAKNKKWTNGVPNYTIQGKYIIEGAQDPQEFLETFTQIVDDEASA